MYMLHKDIKYVSFDLYDTVIKRSVSDPSDIFVYVKRTCDLFKIPCPDNFVEVRVKADDVAQRKYDGCATLDEIYAELGRMISSQKLEEVKNIEIDLEIENAVCNTDILEKYMNFVSMGMPIIFISDMYLPSKVMRKILDKCGIKEYEKIYISCEARASKGKGNLFEYVLSDLKIKPFQLFHFGDNKKGDWIIPAIKGIKTERVKPVRFQYDFQKFRELDVDCGTIASAACNIFGELSYPERLGCMTLGPVLLGFIKWLDKSITVDSVDTVLFLSRDGYIMKQVFEKTTHNNNVDIKYVYCSRRAFIVPLIWKCSTLEELRQLIPFPHKLSLRLFASRIGIDHLDGDDFKGIDADKEFEKFALFEQPFFYAIFDALLEQAIVNSKKEFEAIKRYFSSLDLKGNIAVVDIGYHGTMQYAFERLLKEMNYNVHITGYYLDIANDISPITEYKIKAKGYLDDVSHYRGIYDDIQKFLPLFELSFLAPHGSTQKFIIDGYKTIPVLFPFEYNDTSHDYEDIQEFQVGAFKLIDYLLEHGLYNTLNITPEMAMWNYNKMGLEPTLQEANFWGEKLFFEYGSNYIAKPKSLCNYLCHYQEAKKDFSKSFWKIGFLKRVFRFKLPYEIIYHALKEFYY